MDLFSLEVEDNEILCLCNLCDTGLYNESELVKHLKEQPEKVFFYRKVDGLEEQGLWHIYGVHNR